ncbi:MAG: alpha-glucosidase C-terminal domain-containing protein, partial [Oscillospiraceae bacterium]|nr:alpha-glucosidase C-terminal domain-containing protein [Oscillospiraceae bacterium]
KLLLPEHPQLFAYKRTYEGKSISVWCNFSEGDVALPQEALGELLLADGLNKNELASYGFLVAADR